MLRGSMSLSVGTTSNSEATRTRISAYPIGRARHDYGRVPQRPVFLVVGRLAVELIGADLRSTFSPAASVGC
jgi:hypothetical protein